LAGGAFAVGYFLWNRDRFLTWQRTDQALDGHEKDPDYVARRTANNTLAASIHDASVINVTIAVAAGALVAGGIALVALAPRTESPVPPAVPAPNHALQIGPGYIGWRADW
jgi:hypothetical protein